MLVSMTQSFFFLSPFLHTSTRWCGCDGQILHDGNILWKGHISHKVLGAALSLYLQFTQTVPCQRWPAVQNASASLSLFFFLLPPFQIYSIPPWLLSNLSNYHHSSCNSIRYTQPGSSKKTWNNLSSHFFFSPFLPTGRIICWPEPVLIIFLTADYFVHHLMAV